MSSKHTAYREVNGASIIGEGVSVDNRAGMRYFDSIDNNHKKVFAFVFE